jgi:uracil-DNA glycosylase
MPHEFDTSYATDPWLTLCKNYPDSSVYPAADFRVEWGPVFHRGRLDGTARVVVIGQDPGQHESIGRRILIGEAGQRVQGFLARLGIDKSYVMVNAFLYSVYGQSGGQKHKDDPGIVSYRNQWLDPLLLNKKVQAVIALGALADRAYQAWSATQPVRAGQLAYQHITHPTQPISAGKGKPAAIAALTKTMLQNWNAALTQLHAAIKNPDRVRALVPYGSSFKPGDDVAIPEKDMPAGTPAWMRSVDAWATRSGATAAAKRATVVITVPKNAREW